ncbi:Protein csh3-like protein [Cladobotryum mycophilum]|uniref:Protein csh3-like protein n=1 Tax=Cladobotryum mycophilum TaxID=491253 RepID=A0ABR0T379_9HYPO
MDRQTIMETNRSLRTIKTELENLLEKGVIDESAFDSIHAALPAETPLRGAGAAATRSNNPTPAQNSAPTSPPVQAFQNLNVNSHTASPPSYDDTPAPSLPARSAKPVISHARALYRYAATDARDLAFEKDDKIAVYEHMNQDWWMGQNTRTGKEGIFPQNYVLVEQEEKGPPAAAYPQQPTYGYPASQGPPAQQNPYNSSVPPMAVAEGGQPAQQQGGDSKVGEYGKKFGKKLGNAAIFGAGASIGSNIVNSIF